MGASASKGGNGTAAAHGLVEYVERCAIFFGGRPRNCWVDRTYAARPACKRYLYKGLYGEHVAFYASLFSAESVGVLASERLFDATTRPAAVASVLAFLDLGGGAPAGAPRGGDRTCWHDCGVKKSNDAIAPGLRADLDALYAPSLARLDALLAAGEATPL